MGIKKVATTSLLAIAATGIAAGTAYGEPATTAPTSLRGADRGVTYTTTLSQDHTGVTTALKSGTFALSSDAMSVTVTAPDGAVVQRLPMSFQVAGQQLRLKPELNRDGTTLTLRPAGETAAVRDVSAYNHDIAQAKDIGLVGAAGGVVVGAAIGAVIGAAVGALFLVVGAVPGFFVGLVAGAAIGAVIGAFVI